VAIVLRYICHQVLQVVLQQISDFVRHPRVGAPSSLDGQLQLVLVEVYLRLARIYSDILQQHLVQVILAILEVPEKVVPLLVVHILATFIFIITSKVDVDAVILALLIIIL
jgi:hypothetical protein